MPPRGGKNFKPRPQNRILLPLRDSIQNFRRVTPSFFIWEYPPGKVSDTPFVVAVMRSELISMTRTWDEDFAVVKVHLTPKYFFRSYKSLHLFETHCAFLPRFNPNLDFFTGCKRYEIWPLSVARPSK